MGCATSSRNATLFIVPIFHQSEHFGFTYFGFSLAIFGVRVRNRIYIWENGAAGRRAKSCPSRLTCQSPSPPRARGAEFPLPAIMASCIISHGSCARVRKIGRSILPGGGCVFFLLSRPGTDLRRRHAG